MQCILNRCTLYHASELTLAPQGDTQYLNQENPKEINAMSDILPSALEAFLKRFEGVSPLVKPVAVFDCDGTLIKGDIGEAMFYYQLERFLFRVNPANIWLDHPRREELDNLYTQLMALPLERRTQDRRFVSLAEMMVEWYFDLLREGKTEQACSDIVRLCTKFSEKEVEQIARATVQEELDSPVTTRKFGKYSVPKGIRYIRESVTLLKRLQQAGFDVWAVSGSNMWSAQAVFERVGIGKERVIGVGLQLSSNTFSAKTESPVPVLEGKVEALQQRASSVPVIVVSDSLYDVPLFKFASELRVLINSRMENSYTFFKNGKIEQDDSWVVIEHPTAG